METPAASVTTEHVRTPLECVMAIQAAINQHDLEALATCFDPDYKSEFPAHLGRRFRGHTQMRKNWSQIFATVPDLHADLLRSAGDGEIAGGGAGSECDGGVIEGEGSAEVSDFARCNAPFF